jgi:signal transduction histidine kinase
MNGIMDYPETFPIFVALVIAIVLLAVITIVIICIALNTEDQLRIMREEIKAMQRICSKSSLEEKKEPEKVKDEKSK